MMPRDWDLLFSEYELSAVLEAQLKSVKEKVLAIAAARFGAESDEELAAHAASMLVVEPIAFREADIEVSAKDAKIDVSHDFNRGIRDRSHPFYIDGQEVTYAVPFDGDEVLLKCRPDTFTFNPPRAVIHSRELRFPYDVTDGNVQGTKSRFEQDMRSVREYAVHVTAQVAKYNLTLEAAVKSHVAARRTELTNRSTAIADLGFKVRSSLPSEAPQSLQPPKSAGRPPSAKGRAPVVPPKEFDVALSFAGEDRAYVEEVAERLRSSGVGVFYDRFEEVDLWGADLAAHLADVYAKRSRFVVLFVSQHYAAKAWPNHEKRVALGRLIKEGTGAILPVRFDNTELPGLPESIGFLDLRVLTPEKLSALVLQKLSRAAGDV